MIVSENISNAVNAIKSNKLRSWLSTLGIIIGISSVVIMLAIGEGAQKRVLSRIEALWTNLITIVPGWMSQGNVRGSQWGRSSTDVLWKDEVELIKTIKDISGISPEYNGRKQVIYGANNSSLTINGVTPDYENVSNFKVAYGQFISDDNNTNFDKVAVLWTEVVVSLFEWKNPIWKDIRIQDHIFTVIWVMEEKWQQGFGNADNVIFIPLYTAQNRIFWKAYLSSISVSVWKTENMETVKSEIESLLMKKTGITNIEEANFTVLNQADMLSTVSDITNIFKHFLWWIWAISLIVWWIGIMNIMLVSVTERTREIWIRKSIWAQKNDILMQFLTESIFLTLVGWCIWIWLSYFIIFIINLAWIIEAVISINSLILSFVFIFFVWVFFGIMPAYKAANLKPIDALRFE